MYLVDVSSMFFRAFYAIRPLTSPSGLPTNAIYGFMSMVIKLLKDKQPDYLVFCYDRKEPSFRKEIDPNYKANRTEMPEDLGPQIPYIKSIAGLLGVPDFEKESFEADDLIGTLADFGRKHNIEVVIVSGDKDFGQIVQPGVTLYDTMKEVVYDEAGVREKWGINPDQVIDYLALVGDTSDNIPGVSGIGPKGAQKLISDFGTLEGIYENINKISSVSLREKLTKDQENAFLSKKLVTIVRDVPMDLSVEKLTRKPVDAPKLRDFLRELNFKAFEKTLLGDENSPVLATPIAKIEETKSSASSIPQDEAVVTTVANAPAEETELSIADAEKLISLQSEIWGVASDTGVYICYAEKLYRLTGSRSDWGQIFSAKKLNWKGHDLKGFWHELKIGEGEILWDSMLAAYIVRAGGEVGFAEVYNKYTGSVLPALASGSQLIQAAFNLEAVLKQKLNEVSGTKVLKEMELPLIPILYRMEEKGVRIDTQILSEQSEGLSKDIKKIEKEIFELAEETFNIGSPKQLGVVLFEKLKLPVGKKTKTGYSTDTDVLSGLAEAHPIANKIIEFRELSKLKSTYVDALPLMINAETKRIHTTFNQAHTATGRLSSINPNLQNIPIRTERGNAVRKAFVADEGNLLVSVDYSQIELRVLAHITQDPGLCRAFEDDLDIHTATAAEIFSVPLKEVTSDLRRKAKAVNFGIAYGQGAFGLAEALGISRSESAEIIKNYFRKFSNVSRFMDETIEKAKETGYVETLFGRRRYLDELKSKSPMIRKFGERAAINAPIQGTASDLVKMAMIQLEGKTELDLLLQVHDELIFEGPNKIIPAELEKICKIMETVTKLRVPLKVNGSSGISWAEAH